MLRIAEIHTDLIGKIAKLNNIAYHLELEYEEMYKVGNANRMKTLLFFQNEHICKMMFLFIDEKPIKKFNETWFCLKEIGNGVNGDWHWFTLNQLIICEQ